MGLFDFLKGPKPTDSQVQELHWRDLPPPEWLGGEARLWSGNRLGADLTGAKDYGNARKQLLNGLPYRLVWARLIPQPGENFRVYAVVGRDVVGYLNQANRDHDEMSQAIVDSRVEAGELRLSNSEAGSTPYVNLRIGKHDGIDPKFPWDI
jgi:hypothetical protein